MTDPERIKPNLLGIRAGRLVAVKGLALNSERGADAALAPGYVSVEAGSDAGMFL
jgi:hypothetical protein